MKKLFLTLMITPIIAFSQNCKGDCENGFGTYKWQSGDKYVGEWKDRKFEGEGTYTYTSGAKYVGEWKNGRKDGEGTHTYDSGDIYVGEWKNGRHDGFGTLTSKAPKKKEKNILYPIKYRGEWKNGEYDGEGTIFFHNGLIWTGTFLKNKQLEGYSNNENYYNASDIIGEKSSITINLTPHENKRNYFIKLSFGDVEKEFLFDTGASQISMSYSFLKKLEKNNIKITKLKIKGSIAETADGEVAIEYYKIDDLKIGEYTVNNTVITVGKNLSLLFGTGILEKFSDWSGPGKKGILKIYK